MSDLQGVQVVPLRRLAAAGGWVLPVLRADAPHFRKFGEAYISAVAPGAVKAWVRHRLQTQNYAVVQGRLRLVLHDGRDGSPTRGLTRETALGEGSDSLVIVPPGIWSGFQCLSEREALLLNLATEPHDDHEQERRDPSDAAIGFNWAGLQP